MLGLLACSEAYEFGQMGTGLSFSSTILFQKLMSSFSKEPMAYLREIPSYGHSRKPNLPVTRSSPFST